MRINVIHDFTLDLKGFQNLPVVIKYCLLFIRHCLTLIFKGVNRKELNKRKKFWMHDRLRRGLEGGTGI